MNILKGNQKIPFDCPECHASINPTVKQIKNQVTLNCTCGKNIQLVEESLSLGIKEANKKYNDLTKKMKNKFK